MSALLKTGLTPTGANRETSLPQLPAGFGRGRKTGAIALIETSTSRRGRLSDSLELLDRDERMDPWTRAALEGFAYAAEWCSFNLLVRYWRPGDTAQSLADLLFPHLADAAILHAPRPEHLPLVQALTEKGVPCVLAFSRVSDPRVPWVVSDNVRGGIEAVAHLARLGHRRIAFLTGPEGNLDFAFKLEGYRDGLAAAGLAPDPGLIVSLSAPLPPLDELRSALVRLRVGPTPPTAVLCVSDTLAYRLMEAASELGLAIPDDLAVVAFDDVEEGTGGVLPLTVIRQPVGAVARMSTYLAACAVVGQPPDAPGWQMYVPTSLIVRASCGAKRAENAGSAQDLERELTALRAANEEMLRLLQVTAHDLQSPLVTIQGFAAKLERQHAQALDEGGRDCVARIQRTTKNLQRLVAALLELYRDSNRPLQLKPTSAREVVERVCADLEEPLRTRGVHLQVSSLLPTVLADPVALYQVLSNLVTNAVKFMGDQVRPSIFLGCDERGREQEFYVRDNGIGIPLEKQADIFLPFQRLGEVAAEGTGAGLALAKSLILRHGGRIWVESEPGSGATFRFTLPRP